MITIHAVEQRTPEWFAARAGRLTASDAALIYTQPKTGSADSKTRKKLILRLALERISGPGRPSAFDSPAMQRGRELEAEALSAYETKTGTLLSTVGFVSRDDLQIGCSPDGAVVIEDRIIGGCEVKCPDPVTHDDYRRAPATLIAAYHAQVLHTLLVTGADWWDIVSYCPEMPAPLRLVIVRLVPDDLAGHESRVRQFINDVDAREAELRQAAQEAQ